MTYMYRDDREEYDAAEAESMDRLLEGLESGDCMVVQQFSAAAKSARGFLNLLSEMELRGIRFRSLQEDFDTGTDQGRYAAQILQKVAMLDGEPQPEKARETDREEGRTKGRKPIEVDEEAFDAILEKWTNGEITARQAMNALNLKPNTFYRRAKERMTEVKNGEAILNAAKQLGKEIITGVAAGTEAAGKAAEKFASEHDVESIANTVTETLGKNLNAAGDVLNRYIDTLNKNFHGAVEQLEKKAEAAAPKAGEVVDAVTEEAAEVAETVTGEASDVVEQVIEKAAEVVEKVAEKAAEVFEKAADGAAEVIEKVADGAAEAIEKAAEEAPEVVEKAAEEAAETAETAENVDNQE